MKHPPPSSKESSKSLFFHPAFLLLMLLYILEVLLHYVWFDADRQFGYLDHQSHWSTVSDLVQGKLIYKDFFWEYGFLTALLRLPFFLLWGQSFYGSFFSDHVVLPIIGIALSVWIAHQFLSTKSAIVFLFLLLLYRSNNDYNGVRHLIPELGLLLVMLGLQDKHIKKKLLGSFFLGLSLISSAEYALAANLSFIVFFVLYGLLRERSGFIKNFITTFPFQIFFGLAFLLYLVKNNIFHNYLRFHLEYIETFYTMSPDRNEFPRLSNLGDTFMSEGGGVSAAFTVLMRLNIYLVFLVLVFMLIWNLYHRSSKWILVNITLILYSFITFYRVLSVPGYIHYGLTFFLLLISSLLFMPHATKRFNLSIAAIIVWLSIASGFHYTLLRVGDLIKNSAISVEKEYLPGAGMGFSKPLTQEYKQITEYITSNTTHSDYVLVYPNGPYNQLAKRKQAIPMFSSYYYGVSPFLVETAYDHLAANKPKYIVMNAYNGPSYISSVNGVKYNAYSQGNDVFIEGLTTKVEDYIQQHYDLDKKYTIAWILKRRDAPKLLEKIYQPVFPPKKWVLQFRNLEQDPLTFDNTISFHVKKTDFEIYFSTEKFDDIRIVKIPMKVDLGVIKPLSKFTFFVYIITADGRAYPIKRGFVTSNWQDVMVYNPQVDQPITIKALMIKVPPNKGFLPWGKPYN